MDSKFYLRIVVFTLIIAVVSYLFVSMWVVFTPFVIAYILNFALKPLVNLLEQRNVCHTTAVLTVFFVTFLLLGIFMKLFIPAIFAELADIQKNLPLYQASLLDKLHGVEAYMLGGLDGIMSSMPSSETSIDLQGIITKHASGYFLSFIKKIPSFIVSIIPFLMYIVIIPFITFFLLLDEYRIKKAFISLVPNRYFEITLNLLHSLNQQFGWLLGGMLITAVIMSTVISFLLWVIGLEFPILVGIFSGVANLIPYAGPIVGTLAAFFISLITDAPNIQYLYILIVFLIANLIDNILIQPLVLARVANLHPLAVIVLITIGSKFGGAFGMLLAVPVASLLQVALKIIFTELARPVRPPFSQYTDISTDDPPSA